MDTVNGTAPIRINQIKQLFFLPAQHRWQIMHKLLLLYSFSRLYIKIQNRNSFGFFIWCQVVFWTKTIWFSNALTTCLDHQSNATFLGFELSTWRNKSSRIVFSKRENTKKNCSNQSEHITVYKKAACTIHRLNYTVSWFLNNTVYLQHALNKYNRCTKIRSKHSYY